MPDYILPNELARLRSEILSGHRRMINTADGTGLAKELFDRSISPMLKFYQPVKSPLASHNSDIIYRARKWIDGKAFENISDLGAPLSPSGRAITDGDTRILYASSSWQTCLAEIGAKIGDHVDIGSFKYSELMNGDFWFIGQLGSFYRSQEQSRYLGDENAVQKYFFAPSEAMHALVYNDLLINEIFSALSLDKYGHELNGLLIESIRNLLEEPQELHGVVFESTKDAPGINFAIYGESIDKLRPATKMSLRVTDIDDYGCIHHELL